MIYLFLSIACSVLIGFIFKLFERYRIQMYQAIMFNYYTCVVCGWIHSGKLPYSAADHGETWMPYALLLGLVFVIGFNASGLTVRYFGVTISQIMQKMSILLTVPFAILVYQESSGALKISGFVLALASIILVNWPKSASERSNTQGLGLFWIPLLTWVLAGVIEIIFILVQHGNMIETGDPSFIVTVFCTAGSLGLVGAFVGWATGRLSFSWRNVLAGVILGVPNYGSMLFMLMALGSGLESSLVFSLINVGIILATTIGAVWLFQERLSTVNWWGVFLAVLAIIFIAI